MRSSGRCPGHWSSAMPRPRIQSDLTKGQPEDGDHGVSLCPGPPPQLCPPVPPSPASQQEDTKEDMWLLYKISISNSILYRVGHVPHLLPFLFPPTSHPHRTLDKVKNPPFMPSYQQQICFFSSLKPAVLCLYQGCTRRKKKKKDWRGKPRNHVNQPWKGGGNVKGYSRCLIFIFLNLQVWVCEVTSQTCPLNPEWPRLKSRVSIPKGKLESG